MKISPIVKLTALEINQKNLMEQLENMNQNNKDEHKSILEVIVRLEDKLDKALDRKANKWVEKAIAGTVVLILTSLAGYLATLIYETTLHVN